MLPASANMALVNSKYLALINQTPAPTLDYEGGNPLETSGIEIPPTDEPILAHQSMDTSWSPLRMEDMWGTGDDVPLMIG